MARDVSRHQCPIKACTLLLPPAKLMCLAHWRMVPAALREAVTDAWAFGAGAGSVPLLQAQTAAIDAVGAKLAGRSRS